MLKIEKTIEIDAPVERVFAYVLDPRHLPEFHPGIAEVKDVTPLANGGYRWTTVDNLFGLHIESTWEDLEVIPNERGVNQIQSPLMDCTAHARFEPLPGGRTRASNVATIALHGGPAGRLAELLLSRYIDHGAEMAIKAAKMRIERSNAGTTLR